MKPAKAEPLIVKENFVTQWKHNNCFFLFNFFFFSNEQDVASQVARVCQGSGQGWDPVGLALYWEGLGPERTGLEPKAKTASEPEPEPGLEMLPFLISY